MSNRTPIFQKQPHSSTKVGLAFCPFSQKSQDKDSMDKISRQCMAQEDLGNITQNLRAAPHLMPKYDWLAVQVHEEFYLSPTSRVTKVKHVMKVCGCSTK